MEIFGNKTWKVIAPGRTSSAATYGLYSIGPRGPLLMGKEITACFLSFRPTSLRPSGMVHTLDAVVGPRLRPQSSAQRLSLCSPSSTPLQMRKENSSQMAQEHHACAVVLGLDPSGGRYDSCIRTLDRSLSEWDQARLVQSARSACAQKGLQPGTPAFAVCVINAEQSP